MALGLGLFALCAAPLLALPTPTGLLSERLARVAVGLPVELALSALAVGALIRTIRPPGARLSQGVGCSLMLLAALPWLAVAVLYASVFDDGPRVRGFRGRARPPGEETDESSVPRGPVAGA